MGGESWICVAKFETDIEAVLQKARQHCFSTFKAAKYPTIEAAVRAAAPDGTGSVLDITRVGSAAQPGVCGPLSKEHLMGAFGTDKPERKKISDSFPEKPLHEIQEESYNAYRETPNPMHTRTPGFRNWYQVRGDLEDLLDEAFGMCERGESFYFLVYEQGLPSEIVFFGCSND